MDCSISAWEVTKTWITSARSTSEKDVHKFLASNRWKKQRHGTTAVPFLKWWRAQEDLWATKSSRSEGHTLPPPSRGVGTCSIPADKHTHHCCSQLNLFTTDKTQTGLQNRYLPCVLHHKHHQTRWEENSNDGLKLSWNCGVFSTFKSLPHHPYAFIYLEQQKLLHIPEVKNFQGEEIHIKYQPVPSVSAQLWHLHTNKKVPVVNRRYSKQQCLKRRAEWRLATTPRCIALNSWILEFYRFHLKSKTKAQTEKQVEEFLSFVFSSSSSRKKS